MNEIWKDIPNYEGMYQVSSLGRVKSLDRTIVNSLGRIIKYKGKIRATQKHNQGYLSLCLRNGAKQYLVHRLVASAFIENKQNKEFVNHKNGDKTDNRVENLEWCTRQENENHAFKTGLKNSSGTANTQAKLKDSDVIYIRNTTLPSKRLAHKFKVSCATINRVRQGVIWKHI